MPQSGEAPLERYELEDELNRKPVILKGVGEAPRPKGPGLCFRCTNSFIYRRKATEFDVIIRCRGLTDDPQMPVDIIECSGFKAQNELSLSDMSQMATMIDDRKTPKGPYL